LSQDREKDKINPVVFFTFPGGVFFVFLTTTIYLEFYSHGLWRPHKSVLDNLARYYQKEAKPEKKLKLTNNSKRLLLVKQ
ncbi:hypothetical protein ACVGW8_00110, partial [Enterobacter hormaechei]